MEERSDFLYCCGKQSMQNGGQFHFLETKIAVQNVAKLKDVMLDVQISIAQTVAGAIFLCGRTILLNKETA